MCKGKSVILILKLHKEIQKGLNTVGHQMFYLKMTAHVLLSQGRKISPKTSCTYVAMSRPGNPVISNSHSD